MTQHINPGTGTTINNRVCIHARVCSLNRNPLCEDDNCLHYKSIKSCHTPAHPPEAQQRVDAAIKNIIRAVGRGLDDHKRENCLYCNIRHNTEPKMDGVCWRCDAFDAWTELKEAIALLQAGRK